MDRQIEFKVQIAAAPPIHFGHELNWQGAKHDVAGLDHGRIKVNDSVCVNAPTLRPFTSARVSRDKVVGHGAPSRR